MPLVKYHHIPQPVETREKQPTLLQVSIDNKVPHLSECGGVGRCTTCRVRVRDGLSNLSPLTASERRMSVLRGWDESIRLACQARVLGDVYVERLVRSGGHVARLSLEELPQSAEGEERHLAILFCDLRAFTPFAEKNLPYDVTHVLHRFYEWAGEPVVMNNGILHQYVGDELVALFGLSKESPEVTCTNAVRAGLGIKQAMQELNKEFLSTFGTEFGVVISAHYASIVIGRIGHPSSMQIAAVGDAMNICSRMQKMSKSDGLDFLASEDLLQHIQAPLALGDLREVQLKGRLQPLKLQEVLSFQSSDIALQVQSTVAKIVDDDNIFTQAFYDNMFAMDPSIKLLFKDSGEAQQDMLAQMLRSTVYGLSRFEEILPGLQAMARRHVKYGVTPEHYGTLKMAVLKTIQDQYADVVNEEGLKAWEDALNLIIESMLLGISKT